MNPRPLDWRSVRPKLRRIEELAATLETIGPVDAATLRTEATTSLAVERILTLFVELAFAVNSHVSAARLGKAPDTYAESFDLVAEAGALDRELADAMKPAQVCGTSSSTPTST